MVGFSGVSSQSHRDFIELGGTVDPLAGVYVRVCGCRGYVNARMLAQHALG